MLIYIDYMTFDIESSYFIGSSDGFMFWTVVKRFREIERSAKTPYLFLFSKFHIFVFYTLNNALDSFMIHHYTHTQIYC